SAQRTQLYGGRLSLQLPGDFRLMTDAEIAAKYPRARPPQYAFTDSDRFTRTITFNRRPLNREAQPLSELGAEMQRQLAVQAGITVHRHGLIDFRQRVWYVIEFRSTTIDQPVENLMRVTVADKHLIVVSANAVRRLFDQSEAALREALGSVTVH
ncbi:MAG TPA: hypothetical protein VJ890_15205, partial [Vineibacter sp.]|nr:hypothetical protein [Vineibacter sp.]